MSTGDHNGADSWEKRRKTSKRGPSNTHMESGEKVMVPHISMTAWGLDHQGGFCWNEKQWTWGCGSRHARVFKHYLLLLTVCLSWFLGSFPNLRLHVWPPYPESPIVWKPYSSLKVKTGASLLLLICFSIESGSPWSTRLRQVVRFIGVVENGERKEEKRCGRVCLPMPRAVTACTPASHETVPWL